MNLYIQGNPANLDQVIKVLNLFYSREGSRINWKKTNLVWASEKERTWTWGEDLGVNWLNKRD